MTEVSRSLFSDGSVPVDAPLVEAWAVTRTFTVGKRQIHALHNVDAVVAIGEMVLVEGKSGSGKTTLLNILGGIDRPSSGRVIYRGSDITGLSDRELTHWRKKRVGFIFQAYALIPGLTAFENVDLAGRIAGLPPGRAAESAMRYLEMIGVAKRAQHRISELSGGEQQRVAVARGLVGEPEIVLADEPTGELDHAMGRRVLDLLRSLVDERKLTVCLTSHDPAVRGYAHRVYTLEDGKKIRELANT